MGRLRRLERMTVAASLGQAAWAMRQQWQAMPPKRRARLQALLRESGGRPGRLSSQERKELVDLLGDLNLGTVLRETAMSMSTRRARRR